MPFRRKYGLREDSTRSLQHSTLLSGINSTLRLRLGLGFRIRYDWPRGSVCCLGMFRQLVLINKHIRTERCEDESGAPSKSVRLGKDDRQYDASNKGVWSLAVACFTVGA